MPDNALPRHIAVIMDGNGRWAKRRGLSRSDGHEAGAAAVRRVVEECRRREIPFLTMYAFSKENWARPESEVSFLFDLFIRFVRKEVPELIRQGIRLDVIGDRADLPFAARRTLEHGMRRTAEGRAMRLTLALSYSGREEILRAARALAGTPPEEITEERFRQELYAPDLPDPDLLIRTSGELRVSNFLLFQCAYTEFYFSDRLWPDFDGDELRRALEHYAGRTRRFGKTDEQLAPAGSAGRTDNKADA